MYSSMHLVTFLHLLSTATKSTELQVFQSGFLFISINLSQKDILSSFSLKAVICALIGVLCLVSPMV